MIYFDAAYIAKFYLDEADSDSVRRLADEAGEVACCMHGRAEVLIVFHRKFRERAFSPKAFAAVCEQFQADCDTALWLGCRSVQSWSKVYRSGSVISTAAFSSARRMRFIWQARRTRVSRKSTPTIVIFSRPRHTSNFAA